MRLGFLFLLAAFSSPAATFYVDIGSGNNANAGTSQGAAWASLPGTDGASGAGWVQLVNGDTAYVKGGTTNSVSVQFNVTNYVGSAATFNSIRIVSGHLLGSPWGTGRAIYDGGNSRFYGFGIDCVGLTVDGFELRNFDSAANSGVYGNGSACLETGSAMNFCTIRRSYLHHATRTVDDTGHGIETAGGGHHLIVEMNNIGPNIGTKGIEIYNCANSIVRSNFVINCGDHNIVISANRCDVYGNLIIAKGPWAHNPVYAMKTTASSNDFWNNVIFMDSSVVQDACGFGFGLPNSGEGGNYNRFVHNTVFRFRSDGQYADAGIGIVYGVGGTPTTNNLMANNLVIACTNQQPSHAGMQLFFMNSTKGANVNHNDLWANDADDVVANYGTRSGPPAFNVTDFASQVSGGSSGTATANVTVNPQFTGGTLPAGLDSDYHPDSGYFSLGTGTPSAVKATGNSLTGNATQGYSSASDKFSLDILGLARGNWSMGAYEFFGSPSTNTQSPGPRSGKKASRR